MKTLEEIKAYYSAARKLAKIEDDANKLIVVDYISAISEHCKSLYQISSVIQQAKCRVQVEAFENIVQIIKDNGLKDVRVKAFFGLTKSSAVAPSFVDIISGEIGKSSSEPQIKGKNISEDETDKTNKAGNQHDDNIRASEKNLPKTAAPIPINKSENAPKQPQSEKRDVYPTFVPESLSDFIGQEHVVKRVLAEISAARKQGIKHIDHILLFGNRGLGKSTLMKLIAKELRVKFEFMDASQLGNDVRSQRAVQKFLQRVSREDEPVVIAFDEIHALPKHIQTALLTLLNDRVYSYMDENGVNHSLPISEFTFIGATTDAQDVLPTLKDRCNNLTFYLKDYTREDLSKIFLNKFASKGLVANDDVLGMCIDRCRASIREVDAFVNGLNTKAINAEVNCISVAMAAEYFKDIDRDPIGLKSKDLEILNHLLNEPTGVMSEDTLAARVHMDAKVLTKEFEPYLLKIGFVNISSRGRSLTQKAINYLTTGSVDGNQSEPHDNSIQDEEENNKIDIVDDLFGDGNV